MHRRDRVRHLEDVATLASLRRTDANKKDENVVYIVCNRAKCECRKVVLHMALELYNTNTLAHALK